MTGDSKALAARKRVATRLGGMLLPLLAALPVGAVDFVVNSSADQSDVLPGNGFCSTSVMFASCTLRAAVEEANALLGPDRVLIGSRTISVATQLDVTEDLVLEGNGAAATVLTTTGSGRLFSFGLGIHTISDLKIEGVQSNSIGGGIYNTGSLQVIRVWLHNNEAAGCGALVTFGPTVILDSTFSHNRAGAQDGGALCLQQGSHTNALNSTFVGNSAARGGAIAVTGSQSNLVLYSATVAADTHGGFRGGGPASTAVYADLGSVDIIQSVLAGTCTYGQHVTTTSFGVNLEGPGPSCLAGGVNDQSSLTAEQLGLGELANYGGPVPTMLPATQSAAVDPVSNFLECLTFDARGEPRHNNCDVGAVERQPSDPESGPIFVDGFESGSTGAWSSSSP